MPRVAILRVFSGCDTKLSFFQHGKCQLCDVWLTSDPTLTNSFIDLSNMSNYISETI